MADLIDLIRQETLRRVSLTLGDDVPGDLRKLIRDPLLTDKLPPDARAPVLGDTGVSMVASETNTAPPVPLRGGFIFYPCSDDAFYSWGDPYESGGTPINPPLGTVLAGDSGCTGTTETIDVTKHPFRLYDDSLPGFVNEYGIEHGTERMGGRLCWKYDDLIISWQTPDEIPFNQNIERVYRNGFILAQGPGNRILASCIRKISGQHYLYCLQQGGSSASLGRAIVDIGGTDQTPSWSYSSGFGDCFNGLTPEFDTFAIAAHASFNKSGTRLVISYMGRRIELDVDTWNAESLVEDTWFANSATAVFAGYGEIVCPVVSGFLLDSDTRRDLEVKITCEQTGGEGGWQLWTANVLRDGSTIRSQQLSYTRYPVGGGTPNYTDNPNDYSMFQVFPFYQSVEEDMYLYKIHGFGDDIDNPSYNQHITEIYRGSERLWTYEAIEQKLGTNVEIWEQGIRKSFVNARDFNELWGNTNAQNRKRWYGTDDVPSRITTLVYVAQECIGYFCELNGDHNDTSVEVLENRTFEDFSGTGFGQVQSPHHYFAMAHYPGGSSVYSMRLFDGWEEPLPVEKTNPTGLESPPTPVWKFANVYVGVTDLLVASEATGPNQRMVAMPCRQLWNEIQKVYPLGTVVPDDLQYGGDPFP